jgi:hypothetical protein
MAAMVMLGEMAAEPMEVVAMPREMAAVPGQAAPPGAGQEK